MKIFENRGPSDRKGSMQMSINAIVILVLAMAVLGLGLGIVSMMQRNVGDLPINVNIEETADSTDVIANLDTTFELRANRDNDLFVSFYNSYNDCNVNGALIYLECDSEDIEFDILQASTVIEQGSAGNLVTRVKPMAVDGFEGDIIGGYACDFQIYCSGEAYDVDAVLEHKSLIIDIVA